MCSDGSVAHVLDRSVRFRAGLAAQRESLDPTLDDTRAAAAAELLIEEECEALRANAVPPVPSGALPPSLQGADLCPHQDPIERILGPT